MGIYFKIININIHVYDRFFLYCRFLHFCYIFAISVFNWGNCSWTWRCPTSLQWYTDWYRQVWRSLKDNYQKMTVLCRVDHTTYHGLVVLSLASFISVQWIDCVWIVMLGTLPRDKQVVISHYVMVLVRFCWQVTHILRPFPPTIHQLLNYGGVKALNFQKEMGHIIINLFLSSLKMYGSLQAKG